MQDQHLDELTEEVFAEELRLLYVDIDSEQNIKWPLCYRKPLIKNGMLYCMF